MAFSFYVLYMIRLFLLECKLDKGQIFWSGVQKKLFSSLFLTQNGNMNIGTQ